MRNFLFAAAAVVTLSACVKTGSTSPYTLTVPLDAEDNNTVAYLVNFDSGEKIDSALVENGEVVFRGGIEKPVMARVILNGTNLGTFILEKGDLTLDRTKRLATGGELNARLNQISDSVDYYETTYRNLGYADSLQREALSNRFDAFQSRIIKENSDNPIGLYYFLQSAYDMPDLKTFNAAIANYPAFESSKHVEELRGSFTAKEATSPGHKFTDFTGYSKENPDSTVSFSSYVGQGKWTVVDFWASWCAPCMREIKVIKELYKEYGPKGLDVVGVAVWDDPENTLQAIKDQEIPWNQVINTQTTATKLYGIMGIPCILLLDPQGNIVARDLRDEDLRKAVADALAE